MAYGIKISKEGQDVKSVSGDNLILEADYTMLKVFSSGTITASLYDGEIEINHNLGYVPHFLIYAGASFDPYIRLGTGTLPIFEVPQIWAKANSTDVTFMVGSDEDATVYYYIFYDQT